jgi:quinol monooxygenase YgiN
MTVVLIATIHGLASTRNELGEALTSLSAAARAADGCHEFEVTRRLDDPSEFVVVSRWDDEGSLRAHFASTEYADYLQAASALLARPSDVTIHYVERTVHPVGDPSSDPRRLG